MKRTLFLVLAFIFLSVNGFAASELQREMDTQAVSNYFEEAYAEAEKSRAALNVQDFRASLDHAQAALNAYKAGKQLAQQQGVEVVNTPGKGIELSQGFQIVRSGNTQPRVLNPLLTFPDLAENILFSKVMTQEYTLAEALRKNSQNTQSGLVAYLQGKVTRMDSAFQYVGDAFASWKGCYAALQQAYEQGQAQVKPEDFCSAK